MPVAKSLKKVEQKLKNKDAVHPKARKFKQLNRATLRETKVTKQRLDRQHVREAQLIRLRFLRDCVDRQAATAVFSEADVQSMIKDFIARDDAEIKKLNDSRRPGRPASSRQDSLQNRRSFEEEEYKSGFYVPNLLEKENVKTFRDWNKEHSGLGLLRFCRISRDGGLQIAAESSALMQE
ncbi:translation machinery-associated protein 16 [Lipomyces oligophaga]|uniref:translation machinery-associated protein 16 n=1 Tax=Lipomyces oligophaga TaxID=45792 RepID=UPI0034CF306D